MAKRTNKRLKKQKNFFWFSIGTILLLVFSLILTVSNIPQKQEIQSSAASGLPSGFKDANFVSGINSPTAMEFAPDGRLFIAEQAGRLRVIKNGQLLSSPFLTVPADDFFERGLLGIAFDPAYATNRYIYVYYTNSGNTKNRISRFTASATNPDVAESGSEKILLDNIPSDAGNHNGGAIHFGPDGKLYAGVGDGGENHESSQSLNSLSGKILRINSDGTIPSDNPFANQAGKRGEIWAYGLRNPFTFAFQPGTGRLFANDVGQGSREEIDIVTKGGNYGWPDCEGSCGSNLQPFYTYQTGAVAGGAFYNSTQFPDTYQGKYFFSDYVDNKIRMIDPNNASSVITFATGAGNPVDLKVGSDGTLYYLSYSGRVGKITYGDGTMPSPTTFATPTTPPITPMPTEITPTGITPTLVCIGPCGCGGCPSLTPIESPTSIPTTEPTQIPSDIPTTIPTTIPTISGIDISDIPSTMPSIIPSIPDGSGGGLPADFWNLILELIKKILESMFGGFFGGGISSNK